MRRYALSGALLVLLAVMFICPAASFSQGPPPALVAVSPAHSGMVAKQVEFVGTINYRVVSEVAAEVSGKVTAVEFEEGQRLDNGAVLVRVDSRILRRTIESTKASYEQALAELESAELDLKRIKPLYEQKVASEQAYDDARFKALALKNRAASLHATLGGLNAELEKKIVRAPFDGVATHRYVERGEWLSPGAKVAALASYSTMDVVVNVPDDVMRTVKKGMAVEVSAGGGKLTGRVTAIVPAGDVSTRTFPVKIRIKNDGSLAGGMDAKVLLPRGEKMKAFIVPRDALVSKFGATVVFAVVDGHAKMIPVEVAAFSGSTAGVRAQALKEGMQVVVKGNERLNDGQPVNVQGAGK